MKRGLRQVPRSVILGQRQSAQAMRLFASAAPSPNVDEIQFQVIGDTATAEYPTRPFTSKSKAQLEEGVQRKANQTRGQFEAKFSADTPEGALFKDVVQIKPYDEQLLKAELEHVTNPTIQPTVDTAVSPLCSPVKTNKNNINTDTKNHNFLTEFMASRTAGYLEDPTLYFSYGENPSATLNPNWSTQLSGNLDALVKRELVDALAALSAEVKEIDALDQQAKKAHEELLQKLQADIDILTNKELFAKSLESSGMSPLHVAQMTDIVTTDPLAVQALPLAQKQAAELAQFRQQSATFQQYSQLVADSRELVKQLQASGLQFDASKVSF
ncbi:uncharacterized protein ACA1_208120 [Acanthamoeba castellanii str. Neff]|uniref:Uncharacterized protein n=1 Tax=Acanthamoeba castellanii (strain ATCC 30010 / Neff) TaxID=1257118 RepID=L8GY60_ACACF|nr:uncharacterized protein ACA1_208120 [Acanthamoeba castellanii str. Neff]ELR17935.1 hypothetical protein ACA1_208120 [Acanthamoeba castellanii str. Neff]